MTPTELVARVRELDQDATPGPWAFHAQNSPVWGLTHVVWGNDPTDPDATEDIAHRVWMAANAALIAEYRSAAPALADALERACELLRRVSRDRDVGWWHEIPIAAFLAGETE